MKILVVEDEKKVAAFIKRGLEQEGYEVLTAHDGDEWVRLGLENTFDLIICDIMLPIRDGLSVVRELRRSGIVWSFPADQHPPAYRFPLASSS